ncbi:SDR family NAD(P)-dependent oxidoreductase [Actinomadura madurae]|uniref:SDR family NAD(P)-dependent oxidoreductase n=1 Tax=Actinomadura madurae TaxID=1993 RepID=UPI0035578648
MDLRLSGKTAVVTGAGRGIGLATVRALTAEGMRVVAASRTAPPEPGGDRSDQRRRRPGRPGRARPPDRDRARRAGRRRCPGQQRRRW